MDEYLRKLVEAPLADPARIYSPGGKRTIKRAPKAECSDMGITKLTDKQARERREKAANDKLSSVLDYYAKTSIPFERIAELAGLYRQVQTGVDDAGKPVFGRVLDVERARKEMLCRGRAA
jgi:hypothetical protein